MSENPGTQQVVVIKGQDGKKVSHLLHLFLAVITGGLWLPVWIYKSIKSS